MGTSGCASGGYKITRGYAGFVNRQHLIIRILLYVFATVVFAVTLILDFVIFNTMDFWQGRVSQGDYEFNKDGKRYVVHHRLHPAGLRESHIEIFDDKKSKLQDIAIREKKQGDIEVYIDGKIKARVSDISELPQLTTFNGLGEIESRHDIVLPDVVAGR